MAGCALAKLELASGRAMLQLTLVIDHSGGRTELAWDAAHAIARMHDTHQTASVCAKAPAGHEVCIGQARVWHATLTAHCCIQIEHLIIAAGRRRKVRNHHLHVDGLASPLLPAASVVACELLQACEKDAIGTCERCGISRPVWRLAFSTRGPSAAPQADGQNTSRFVNPLVAS